MFYLRIIIREQCVEDFLVVGLSDTVEIISGRASKIGMAPVVKVARAKMTFSVLVLIQISISSSSNLRLMRRHRHRGLSCHCSPVKMAIV